MEGGQGPALPGIAIITLRMSAERRLERRGRRESWQTFFPRGADDPFAGGFGALAHLEDDRIPPGGVLSPWGHFDGETLTVVAEGALKIEDPGGELCVLRAGGMQCAPSSHDIGQRARNASRSAWAHVIRLGLRVGEGGRPRGCERRLFTAADRRWNLLLVASRDGRDGSLKIQADARIHSGVLDPGHHLVHELLPGRGAWFHVVEGEVALGGAVLSAGDGAGVTGLRAISITARRPSSVLLVESGDTPTARLLAPVGAS
jgi:redox-sensitive bicupin YhaK (pirin superfamily)